MTSVGKESKEQILRRQSKERFLTFDQQKMIDLFHLEHDDKTMKIRFLGKKYVIDRLTGEMNREDRPADLDEMASVYELLTMSEKVPAPVGEWASISQLCTNTTDTSLTRYIDYLKPFEDHMELMPAACEKLGGTSENKGDVSSIIPLFENVSVWFQYWEKDDEFPASVQFLFDADIISHFRWSILWNVMTCVTKRMKEEVGLL